MTDYLALPRAFYPQGPRRSYVRADRAKSGAHTLPTNPTPLEARCPPAILDSSPDGSGIGVWVLVEEGGGECVYEYGGGIA